MKWNVLRQILLMSPPKLSQHEQAAGGRMLAIITAAALLLVACFSAVYLVLTKSGEEVGTADIMRLGASLLAPFLLSVWGFGRGALYHLVRTFVLFGGVLSFLFLGLYALPFATYVGLAALALWLADTSRTFLALGKTLLEEVQTANQESGSEYYPM